MSKKAKLSCDDISNPQKYGSKSLEKCRYCGTMHKPHRCLTIRKDAQMWMHQIP